MCIYEAVPLSANASVCNLFEWDRMRRQFSDQPARGKNKKQKIHTDQSRWIFRSASRVNEERKNKKIGIKSACKSVLSAVWIGTCPSWFCCELLLVPHFVSRLLLSPGTSVVVVLTAHGPLMKGLRQGLGQDQIKIAKRTRCETQPCSGSHPY